MFNMLANTTKIRKFAHLGGLSDLCGEKSMTN